MGLSALSFFSYILPYGHSLLDFLWNVGTIVIQSHIDQAKAMIRSWCDCDDASKSCCIYVVDLPRRRSKYSDTKTGDERVIGGV